MVKDQIVIFRWLLKFAKECVQKVDGYKNKTIVRNWVNKKTH